MKIIEYEIIRSKCLMDFPNMVNNAIKLGFQPLGSPGHYYIDGEYTGLLRREPDIVVLYQAVVKYDDN